MQVLCARRAQAPATEARFVRQLDRHRVSLRSQHPGRGSMQLAIELEREDDGRWIAEVPALAGVLAYGQSREQAVAKVQALALRVLAERLEHGETAPELLTVSFQAG